MKLLQTLIILFCVHSFSQSLEEIKKSDTLYIRFEKGKNLEHMFGRNNKNEKISDLFYFYLNKPYSYVMFSHAYNLNPERKLCDKSFWSKNNQQIIDYSFFQKYRLEEIVPILESKKKVYLIDNRRKSKNIILNEVRIFSTILHDE